LPAIQGDEVRVRQVILHLLSNAFRFTLRDGEVKLACRENEGFLIFTVADHGPGMSESVQKRLFEPYQRWEDDAGILSGLRIGLALSKMLVELHGGKIWVKSYPGSGSTFGFSLPVAG
jgi:signal transduction histidine kinase